MSDLPLIEATDLAAEAAALLLRELREATAGGRRASIALSGGETPRTTLERLQPGDLDWSLVDVFQVDERLVGRHNPDRNVRMIETALLSRVPAVAWPMPVEDHELGHAADAYAASLPLTLDIVQLGLGADGHTASLIPGDAVLAAGGDVALTGPYQGHRRMTLTIPAINRARRTVWIVAGAAKREALAALLDGTVDIPANRIDRANAIVIADGPALGR
ncbi:MAG: 6-phosphogluconolactonase [Bauldia sp.]